MGNLILDIISELMLMKKQKMHLKNIMRLKSWITKAIENEDEIYLFTDCENIKGKYVYEKIGFKNTCKKIYEEDLYYYQFNYINFNFERGYIWAI